MANLRTTAQQVLEEARDGIAWIAVYRKGRGWGAACFWPDIDRDGGLAFDAGDTEELKPRRAISARPPGTPAPAFQSYLLTFQCAFSWRWIWTPFDCFIFDDLEAVPIEGKVDAMGNLLAVVVHAANIHDTKSGILAAKEALEKYPSIQRFCADAGYRKKFEQDVSQKLGPGVDMKVVEL